MACCFSTPGGCRVKHCRPSSERYLGLQAMTPRQVDLVRKVDPGLPPPGHRRAASTGWPCSAGLPPGRWGRCRCISLPASWGRDEPLPAAIRRRVPDVAVVGLVAATAARGDQLSGQPRAHRLQVRPLSRGAARRLRRRPGWCWARPRRTVSWRRWSRRCCWCWPPGWCSAFRSTPEPVTLALGRVAVAAVVGGLGLHGTAGAIVTRRSNTVAGLLGAASRLLSGVVLSGLGVPEISLRGAGRLLTADHALEVMAPGTGRRRCASEEVRRSL